jgi:hypothetical protein
LAVLIEAEMIMLPVGHIDRSGDDHIAGWEEGEGNFADGRNMETRNS